jgi:hypothetical protein
MEREWRRCGRGTTHGLFLGGFPRFFRRDKIKIIIITAWWQPGSEMGRKAKKKKEDSDVWEMINERQEG